jgi:hypothetical protein
MKISIRFILLAVVLLCLGISFSNAATVTSIQSGDWSSTATWNTGNVPTAADSVVIRASDSVAVFTGPYTCKSLTVLGKLTDTVAAVSAGGQGDLVVTNVLTLASGSYFYLGQKLTALPTAALKIIDAASTIVFYGTQSSVAETMVGNLWIKTTSGGINFAGSMTIFGNLTCRMSSSSNAIKGTTATSGSLTHTVYGNVTINAGIFSAVDVGTAGTVGIWNIHGNVLISSDGGTAGLARMGPFSSASSAGLGIFNIDSNLTIDNGGRLQAGNSGTAGTGTGIINLKGNLTLTSTATINGSNIIGVYAINFIGSGTQTITNDMASGFSNQNTFYDTVAVGSTVVFASTTTWSQSENLNPVPAGTFAVLGTLKLGTAQITTLQNVDVQSGATLTTGAATGIDGAITATGTKTFSTSANYGFDGTSAQQTGITMPATVNDLTIDNTGGVLLSQPTTVNGLLYLTNGVLDNCNSNVTVPTANIVIGQGNLACPPVGVEESPRSVPRIFQLDNSFPNPFNPSTQLRFTVPVNGYTTLKVYNVLGQEVAMLFNGIAQAGEYVSVVFNAASMPSGVYYARLQQNDKSMIQQMVLIK